MRYITFFVLFFVSTMSFAAGIQKSSDAALSKTIQKDVKTLVQQGRKEVQWVKDRELNRYFSSLLKEQENIMKTYLWLSGYSYSTKSLTDRNAFYQSIFKPLYQSTVATIHAGDYSRTIDTTKKSEIENALLSYQNEVLSSLSDQIMKSLTFDVRQKGNMAFSYESGSSYVHLRLQDYSITQSIKRDEETMNFTMKADYNMDIPGKKSCEYDDNWKYNCTTGTGTHTAGTIGGKIQYSVLQWEAYIHVEGLDISTEVQWIEKKDIDGAIALIKNELNGKTYHIPWDSMNLFGSQLKNVEKMTQIIQLLKETSILTPVVRVGEEYVLNWNPIFVEKANTIIDRTIKPTGYLFPEFRYKNSVFFLSHIDDQETRVDMNIAKDVNRKTLGMLSIRDSDLNKDLNGQLSLTLGKNLWNLDFSMSNYLSIKSNWNGDTTYTEISWTGLTEAIRGMLYENTSESVNKLATIALPKKLRIYGNLNTNLVSLKFDLDNTTFGTLDSFQNGPYMNYRLYLNIFGKKFELTWDSSNEYGTFTIEKPKDAVELDKTTEKNLKKITTTLSPQ